MAHERCKSQIAVLEMNGQSVPQRCVIKVQRYNQSYRVTNIIMNADDRKQYFTDCRAHNDNIEICTAP